MESLSVLAGDIAVLFLSMYIRDNVSIPTSMAVQVGLHTNYHDSTGRTTHQLAWQYR